MNDHGHPLHPQPATGRRRRTLAPFRRKQLPPITGSSSSLTTSRERLADGWDLSWHPRARHVREEQLGLTPARLRAIEETSSDLLIFVDDDNVLASDYLAEESSIFDRYPELGVYGGGVLAPDFESEPPQEITPQLGLLALRTVSSPRQSRNPTDYDSTPWGAGLCVRRSVAHSSSRRRPRRRDHHDTGQARTQLFAATIFRGKVAWVGFGILPQWSCTPLTGVLARRDVTRSSPLASCAVRHYVFDRLQRRPRRCRRMCGSALARTWPFERRSFSKHGSSSEKTEISGRPRQPNPERGHRVWSPPVWRPVSGSRKRVTIPYRGRVSP